MVEADTRLSRGMQTLLEDLWLRKIAFGRGESKSSSAWCSKGSRKAGGKLVVAEFAATVSDRPRVLGQEKELRRNQSGDQGSLMAVMKSPVSANTLEQFQLSAYFLVADRSAKLAA